MYVILILYLIKPFDGAKSTYLILILSYFSSTFLLCYGCKYVYILITTYRPQMKLMHIRNIMVIKLCENTKNYKSAYPGSNKVVHGAYEQESEEKNSKF